MNKPGVIALGALAVALFAVLMLELADPFPAQRAIANIGRVAPSAAQSVVADRSAERAAIALARPLFSRDRRPVPDPANATRGSSGLPRLTGIVVGPALAAAIFAGAAGGRAAVIPVGGSIAGYTVTSIEPGRVILNGPDGPQSVRPVFDATGRPAAASPAQSALAAAFRPAGVDQDDTGGGPPPRKPQ